METKRQEVEPLRYRDDELEAKIDDAKSWINAPNSEGKREEFQHMAKLIAQRSPEYIAELDAHLIGDLL